MYDDDKYIINYWGGTSMIHICMYMDIFFRTVEGGRGGFKFRPGDICMYVHYNVHVQYIQCGCWLSYCTIHSRDVSEFLGIIAYNRLK